MVRDYSKAKIYKIIDNTNGNIYIGSTLKSLSQRIAGHRSSYKDFLNGKGNNITSFEILKNGDYNIILIEEYKDCQNIEQLRAKERYYIELMKCLNKNIPGRERPEYIKHYTEQNKDKIKEHNKQYYQKNKEIHSIKSKEYYKKNQEKILQKAKLYCDENKEKTKARKLIKYTCECGVTMVQYSKANHLKTKKHQDYIQSIQQPN